MSSSPKIGWTMFSLLMRSILLLIRMQRVEKSEVEFWNREYIKLENEFKELELKKKGLIQ